MVVLKEILINLYMIYLPSKLEYFSGKLTCDMIIFYEISHGCSSGSFPVFYLVLSPNNRCGQIYLIILIIIILTPNFHLERLLASLSFSQTFLLCSTTAFSFVFSGLPFPCTFYFNILKIHKLLL